MANKRGKQTVRDLVLSMVVIGAVVAVIYVFIPHDPNADPVKPIGFQSELSQARRDAPFPVAAPEGLGKDWRATTVTYNAKDAAAIEWHLGFVDPQNEYAAVEQGNAPAAKFITEKSKKAVRDGARTVTAGGVTWDRYKGPKYNALVRVEKGVTTMITGTAPDDQLAELAAALKAS
ncbi:DUF4245 domain-containing protein [Streptomyces sp. H10-C2]|uniref:DUF4245 domain-containing protein n=1 Tax=unclassified Streptomyces TaxID=2593676 RepID=UPI0024BAF7BC|nr:MULTISPECIES: DUF4245 domain-containing protein [unclassified Streptomyces]MDJ0342717.1 DUF4245 domain-containing protein [Streptomyces sp. PH10-H1]MDJ0372574.1 DUF4245 domain-containing protein [Streptomyces sp. H10-C2]